MASFNKSLDRSRSEKMKHDRMQEVRRQEHEWSKKVVNDFKTSTIQQKQIDEREKAKQIYQQKLAELEKIKMLKEEALLQIGEAQRKAAEQAAIVEQQNQQRKKKMEETQKMAQSRFYVAQEWQKSKWQETEEGKHQARLKHLQETSTVEKQKEKSLVMTFKQNQSLIAQQDYSNLLEKNKKAPLRPEDFAKTCFHNPVSVKHDLDEQKENAYEKANSVFIESQSQLEQTAKMWREQERLNRERGLKAISKERTKKVMEDMEQETKFLKQHLLEENMKELKSPFMKKATKPKTTQEKLSKEFDKLFVEEPTKPKSGVKDNRRTSMQSSTSKERPKSLTKFQKQPLDSGLYKPTQTTERQDYMEYPLTSPNKLHTDIDESNEKRKVKFQVPDVTQQSLASQSFGNTERNPFTASHNTDTYVDSLKQSKNKLNMLVQQQEQMQQEDEEDMMSDVQSQQLQETISINTSPTQFQQHQPQYPQKIHEIKSYIQEQEDYLAKLEQERKRITENIQQDELQLTRTFNETKKLLVFPNHGEIPEEESNADDDNYQLTSSGKYFQESENTYKNLYETDDQSQLTSNPSYVNPQMNFGKQTLRDTNRSPENRKTMQQTFGNQYTFQGALHNSTPANHQSEGSPSAYEYSPESKDYSNKKEDNIDTDEIMRRFLKPQLNNPAQENLNRFIQKQQQKQQRQKSPESELSYKFSELGQSNEKNQAHNINQELILIQDQSPDKSVENYEDDEDDKESPHFDNYPAPKQSGFFEMEDEDAPKGSLSEIFQKRRAELNRRFQEKQKPVEESKPKIEKTKQELMEIRKNMMKRQKKHDEETEGIPVQQATPTMDKKAKLMQRLAQGQKAQVDNNEMYALTQKNYGQLPEVLKKKQQQEKLEDFKRRQEKVKELDKQTRSKLNK